ncbi:musculoskeletal embryonic nuclear protein 1-like [Scleropages formosus]|uniref:Musculoskeletal embryonic nuclear protein 1 n=1 Tax=Scleropages formosus TaxID=113540 RepID=A0A8C9VFK7_SCLFO|nr:musculoskeletal embryonic nuclear protein 1-like [Scleropages formosus]
MSQPQSEEEEMAKKNRPEMKEEDLIEAREKLASKPELRGKTFEVMKECEQMGKVAPSVFSSLRSGGETAIQKPPARRK